MTETVSYNPENCHDIRVFDLDYCRDKNGARTARIYQPVKEGVLPALIDVHGGAWSAGDHTTNAVIDKNLAASGLLVFAVGCRIAPDHTYPAQTADVSYATRWLKSHAREFSINPSCIGGLGTSSGGHSLFLSAMRPEDPRYNALPIPEKDAPDARLSYLIGAWPVLDPFGRYLFAKENKIDFLVKKTESYFQTRDNMVEGNPQLVLERNEHPDLPPVLLIQGTADENLPPDSAARFVEAFRAAGGDAELSLFKEMPHGFALKPGPDTQQAMELIKAFISRQLTSA